MAGDPETAIPPNGAETSGISLCDRTDSCVEGGRVKHFDIRLGSIGHGSLPSYRYAVGCRISITAIQSFTREPMFPQRKGTRA